MSSLDKVRLHYGDWIRRVVSTTKSSPSRVVTEAKIGDESNVVPLRSRTVGNNNGTLMVSLPKETARGRGIEAGNKMQLEYDAESGEFRIRPADKFDGR